MFGDTSCGGAVLAVIRQLAPLASSPAHLVTGRTARLQSLGVVAAAVEGPVLVEVDEVHHQLLQQGGGGREGPGGQTGLEVNSPDRRSSRSKWDATPWPGQLWRPRYRCPLPLWSPRTAGELGVRRWQSGGETSLPAHKLQHSEE